MENEPRAGMSGICNFTREVTMTVLCSSDEADGIHLQDLQFSVFRWLRVRVVMSSGTLVPTFQWNVSFPSLVLKGEAVALKCWYAFPGLHCGVITQNTTVHMGR